VRKPIGRLPLASFSPIFFIMCTVFILTFDLVPNFDQTGPLFQVPYISMTLVTKGSKFKVQTKKIPLLDLQLPI
jgi:hypothetical protein